MTRRARVVLFPAVILATIIVCGFQFPAAAQTGQRSQDLYTLIEQAQAHVVAGRWQSAITVYLDAWKVSRDPGYLYNIAVLYLVRLKDEAKALDYAEKYSEQARTDSEKLEAEGLIRRIRDSIKGTHGRIVVQVLPARAQAVVYVDNRPLGEDNWVTAGVHTLGVQAPGYVPFSREIEVVAGTETSFSVQLKTVEGQVSVRCDGGPCKVLVDGDEIGQAPVSRALSPGEHSVEIDASGRQLFSDWVVIESGMKSSLVVSVDSGRVEVTTESIGAESGIAVVEDEKPATESKADDAGKQWAKQVDTQSARTSKIGPQKAAAISMWVLSGVVLGVGTGMYFLAQDKLDTAALYYETFLRTTKENERLWLYREQKKLIGMADTLSYVAYGSWGLSGAALITGLALWFTAPADSAVSVLPSGPGGPGATVLVRW
ncbi:MAG TPA: PEGA domain-containing protein [Myxococcota bacterium]|nr:PEGA domain-containing protein [Myxococcota bacterium]HOH75714.1 PEGA domain-containing protein [Myxococcota bacterium]